MTSVNLEEQALTRHHFLFRGCMKAWRVMPPKHREGKVLVPLLADPSKPTTVGTKNPLCLGVMWLVPEGTPR